MTGWVLGLLLAAYAPQQAGSALLDPPREARVQALGKQLRCPMCQGLSIADSGSSAARAQMDKVRELVAAGKTDQEIRDLLHLPLRGMGAARASGEGDEPPGVAAAAPPARRRRRGHRPDRGRPAPGRAAAAAAETEGRPPPADDPYLEAVRAELRR